MREPSPALGGEKTVTCEKRFGDGGGSDRVPVLHICPHLALEGLTSFVRGMIFIEVLISRSSSRYQTAGMIKGGREASCTGVEL